MGGVGCGMADVGWRMWDGGCLMWEVECKKEDLLSLNKKKV